MFHANGNRLEKVSCKRRNEMKQKSCNREIIDLSGFITYSLRHMQL